MDWSNILVAVLGCVGTLIGSMYGIKKTTSLVEYRLTQLEHKVDIHNHVIERCNTLETRIAILEDRKGRETK